MFAIRKAGERIWYLYYHGEFMYSFDTKKECISMMEEMEKIKERLEFGILFGNTDINTRPHKQRCSTCSGVA